MIFPLCSCDAMAHIGPHIVLDIRKYVIDPSQCSFCHDFLRVKATQYTRSTYQEGESSLRPCRRERNYKLCPDLHRSRME